MPVSPFADPFTASALPQTSTPAAEYTRRHAAHIARAAALEQTHIQLGYLRLLLVLALLALAWSALYRHTVSPLLLALPALIFLAIAVMHTRILRRQAQARRSAAVYTHGLARIEDRWIGLHPRPTPAHLPVNLYAADLDIVGPGSLFELLSTARTRMGDTTLLRWLLTPAPVPDLLERQAALRELRTNLDLHEAMATAGDATGAHIEAGTRPEELLHWAEMPPTLTHAWLPAVGAVLTLLALAAAILWARTGSPTPFLGTLIVEAILARSLRRPIRETLAGTDQAFRNLRLLSDLLQRLEAETFHAPRLLELQAKFQGPASLAIARLGTLVQTQESRNNPIVRALDVPLLFTVQLACAISRWRREHGAHVRQWLASVGDFEALLSLAAYSYEHPGDPFPTFTGGTAAFLGEDLGHPLLPSDRCVRNSVSIAGETRALLVSGSNMSGKSTLMRTVGINTVLAMAGAPVRASALRLTPLHLGASLLVNDSLQSGSSRFYAEIERLRDICQLAEAHRQRAAPPVLFLLDELLQGTNSRDRLAGAEGVLHALLDAGAIGIITTHDLSLTAIGNPASLRNLHFEDEIADGRMRFDFNLREGIVTRSNGVELMRLIGLKV